MCTNVADEDAIEPSKYMDEENLQDFLVNTRVII